MQNIIFWLLAVLVILWGIAVYFIRTKKLAVDTWYQSALGLPRGSVRALIAFLLLFLLIIPAVTKTPLPDMPVWLVGILGTVIGFYFGTSSMPRSSDKPAPPGGEPPEPPEPLAIR